MTSQPTMMVRSTPDTGPTLSASDPRNVAAVSTAAASIAIWVLATYVHVPGSVLAAVATLVPAAIAWAGSHRAYIASPPRSETPIPIPPPVGSTGTVTIQGPPAGPATKTGGAE